MTNVVVQPARNAEARRNFARTVDSPVRLAEAVGRLPAADLDLLHRLHPSGSAPMWGTAAGERGQMRVRWDRLAKGDVILFTGDNEVFKTATLTHAFRSPDLADHLWERKKTVNGRELPWEYMFAFNPPMDVSVPYRVIKDVLGDLPFPTREFTVAQPEVSDIIIATLARLEVMPTPPPGAAAAKAVVREFDDVDGIGSASYRKEQNYLRQFHASGSTGICVLCGREFPVALLVAAHIKKRAECTLAEKLDIPAIAMLACRFGCDELFERRMIAVRADGRVEKTRRLPAGSATGYFESYLAGRVVHRWSAILDSHRYFAEHRARAHGG